MQRVVAWALVAVAVVAVPGAAPGPPAEASKISFDTGWAPSCWVRSDLLPRPDVPVTSLCRLALSGAAGTDAASCDEGGCLVTVILGASAMADTPTLQVAGLADEVVRCQGQASLPAGPGAPPVARCEAEADLEVVVGRGSCTPLPLAARATVAVVEGEGLVGLLPVTVEVCLTPAGTPTLHAT